ncbi:MAG: ceramidase [Gammaproteobacteria bacterium]|nr:ceramidase [Gammaproteobacteria bacterium]
MMTQQDHSLLAPYSPNPSMASWMITGVTLTFVIFWLLSEPLHQNPLYHSFADQRSMFGVPHALNVLSNVVFCLAGIWGCTVIAKRTVKFAGISVIYMFFFAGIFFTGLGSAYYHWSPDNSTLMWDRLPMSVGFMAFSAVIVSERCKESLGYKLFPWLLFIGVLSVVYWIWQNDLRPYYVVQFGSMLVLPLIIWRFSGPGTCWLWLTVALYALAKLLELFDHQVLQMTEGVISGHTLKHLAAAAGAFMMVVKINTHVAKRQ